jgi:hypothetical protein
MHLKPSYPILPYSNTPFCSHGSAHRSVARLASETLLTSRVKSIARMRVLILCALIAPIVVASDLRAVETKASWQVEWEKVVQAAKKEGQVTVYVHSTYAPALESGAFQKAFPEIKLVSVSGVELQLERRFMAERRAEKYLADVFMVGVLRSYDFYQTKLLEPIKTVLILPEVLDESKWWQKTHHYADPEKKYLFRYGAPRNWVRSTTTRAS